MVGAEGSSRSREPAASPRVSPKVWAAGSIRSREPAAIPRGLPTVWAAGSIRSGLGGLGLCCRGGGRRRGGGAGVLEELLSLGDAVTGLTGEAVVLGEVGQRLVGLGEELVRSEEHTSELQSLMRISYAVFCLKTKKLK